MPFCMKCGIQVREEDHDRLGKLCLNCYTETNSQGFKQKEDLKKQNKGIQHIVEEHGKEIGGFIGLIIGVTWGISWMAGMQSILFAVIGGSAGVFIGSKMGMKVGAVSKTNSQIVIVIILMIIAGIIGCIIGILPSIPIYNSGIFGISITIKLVNFRLASGIFGISIGSVIGVFFGIRIIKKQKIEDFIPKT